MKQIPNFFTLLNLVFGCLAIIFILQTGESFGYINSDDGFTTWILPEKITWGCLFIFAAALVDFLDGFVARLFKASSKMGMQLDSLADAVSFGVAPGMIFYQLLRLSFASHVNAMDTSMAVVLPALIVPCAAVWRLAKFNLDDSQQYSFRGVPTPSIGLVSASLPLIIYYGQFGLEKQLLNIWVLYAIIIVLSFLMVSNLRLLSLKFKNFGMKDNMPKYLLAGIAIIAIIFLKWVAVPVVLLAYVLVSLIFKNKTA